MTTGKESISKLISYWLRHNPSDAGLSVDEAGWVSTEDLLAANGKGVTVSIKAKKDRTRTK